MQTLFRKNRNQQTLLIPALFFVALVSGGCASNHSPNVVSPDSSSVYIGLKTPKDSPILIGRISENCFFLDKKWHFLGTFVNGKNLWAATTGPIFKKSCQKTPKN